MVATAFLGVLMYEYDARSNAPLTIALNLLGFAILIATAFFVRYFANPPWKKKA